MVLHQDVMSPQMAVIVFRQLNDTLVDLNLSRKLDKVTLQKTVHGMVL